MVILRLRVTNWVTDLVKLMETHLAILMVILMVKLRLMVIEMGTVKEILKVKLRLMVINLGTVMEILKD